MYGPYPYSPYPPQSGVVYVPMPAPQTSEKKMGVVEIIAEAQAQQRAWKDIVKSLQEEKKDDDDKKKKKDEVDLKRILENLGMLSVFSFPVIWLQLQMLHWVVAMLHGN